MGLKFAIVRNESRLQPGYRSGHRSAESKAFQISLLNGLQELCLVSLKTIVATESRQGLGDRLDLLHKSKEFMEPSI